MTEPIQALVYHQPTLGRRPIFVALAILAVVFGVLAAFMSAAISIQYLRILPSNASIRYSLVPTIFTQAFNAPAYVFLAIAGLAFLLRKRWATTMLCGYICISLLAIFAGLLAGSLMDPGAGIQLMAVTTIGRFIPSMAHAVFDLVVLLLLLNKSVQELFHQASGIEEPLLPDRIRA